MSYLDTPVILDSYVLAPVLRKYPGMEALNRPNWNMISGWTFLLCVLVSGWITPGPEHLAFRNLQLPSIEYVSQKTQAKELLHRTPQSLSLSSTSDSEEGGRNFILHVFETSLPKAYQSQARIVAETLILEANRNHLDPMFLMAVMMTESHFNPRAKGTHGEIGLMQILPGTAKWIAHRSKLNNAINLADPVTNIIVGAAYFAHLRAHFGRVGSRYLAAYNMGILNVHRLLNAAREPKIYADRVLKNYEILYRNLALARNTSTGPKLAEM